MGRTAAAKRTRVIKAPEDRRRELLDAGLRALVEKGADATVADITAAAGVAKGTFYLYFASRDDLVLALRGRFNQEFVADLLAGIDGTSPADWWLLVDHTVDKFVDFLLEHGDVHDAIWHGVPGTNPTAPGGGPADTLAMLADFLRQGAAAGAFAAPDPDVLAWLLFGAIHGAVDIAVERGEVDRDRLVAGSRELLHRALAP